MHSCAPPVARKGAAAPASLRTHEATCPDPPATRLQSWLFAADRARCALEIKERLDRPSRHGEDVDWITVDRRIGLQLDFTATMCKALARAKVVDAADELITRSTVTGGKPCFKRTRLPIEPVLSSLEKGIPEDHVLDEYSLAERAADRRANSGGDFMGAAHARARCAARVARPARRAGIASMQEWNRDRSIRRAVSTPSVFTPTLVLRRSSSLFRSACRATVRGRRAERKRCGSAMSIR